MSASTTFSELDIKCSLTFCTSEDVCRHCRFSDTQRLREQFQCPFGSVQDTGFHVRCWLALSRDVKPPTCFPKFLLQSPGLSLTLTGVLARPVWTVLATRRQPRSPLQAPQHHFLTFAIIVWLRRVSMHDFRKKSGAQHLSAMYDSGRRGLSSSSIPQIHGLDVGLR